MFIISDVQAYKNKINMINQSMIKSVEKKDDGKNEKLFDGKNSYNVKYEL